ncbi:MAG: LuxR C-terminal-related transcriptional regulator [Cyanobacteria bacterium J06629_18]
MELTPKQMRALSLIAAGATNAQAAEAVNVSQRTIVNWKALPNFQKLLSFAVQSQFNSALAQLVCGSQDAVLELQNIITSSDTPARIKVSAISVLLSHASQVRSWALEQRLENLEAFLDEADAK